MKGIILAAGKGTRLYPVSSHISKTLLPLYDKPMIYYPLSTLMGAGIREILIVVSKVDKPYFMRLLGDGKQFGITIEYAIQKNQNGIADALLVGENFIDGDMVALVLGDNIFHGEEMHESLAWAIAKSEGATIFCKQVDNPQAFGVAEIVKGGKVVSIEEKPLSPKSNWAVTGLYVYDQHACKYAKKLNPSARGELEITDLNKMYLEQGRLSAQLLNDDVIWADTGTFNSLLDASNTVRHVENREKKMIGCPEEIALHQGYITKKQLSVWISKFKSNSYYDYLRALVDEK